MHTSVYLFLFTFVAHQNENYISVNRLSFYLLSLSLCFHICLPPFKWSTIKMFATHSDHLLQYMLYASLDTHLHITHIESIKLNSFIPLRDRNTQHWTASGRFWFIWCTCVSCRKNKSNYFLDSLSLSLLQLIPLDPVNFIEW